MTDDNRKNEAGDELFGEADTHQAPADEQPIRAVPRRSATGFEPDDDDQSPDGSAGKAAPGLLGDVGPLGKRKGGQTDEGSGQEGPAKKDPSARKGKRRQISALPALRGEMRPDTPALRAERVEAIRRDLVRRRRRKGSGLLLRLLLFVVLPTMAVGYFLWERAAPLYESNAAIRVLSAEIASGGGGGGGLLGGIFGGGTGTIPDSVAVQKFVLSRDVLQRLDDDHGYISHFQSDLLTWPHQLEPDVAFEDAFDLYERMTTVSFDPTEGVIDLSVRAATPEDAKRFADAVIGYSEEMVDRLSDPIRNSSLADSLSSMQQAEARLKRAQQSEADLRGQLKIYSVEGEFQKEMQIIGSLETQLEERSGSLRNLRRVTGEDDPRVERLRAQVETLEDQIANRQEKLTGAQANRSSLADINGQLQRAQFETTVSMTMFAAAIEAHELAKLEVNRQHKYLAMVDNPSLPDKAAYPKKVQTTALFFLIFLGAYILLSLTISVIREQASI